MKPSLIAVISMLALAGCGGADQAPSAGNAPAAPPSATTGGSTAAPGTAPAPAAASTAAPAAGRAPAPAAMEGRTGELLNPDNNAMVFLYYDLSGMAPPIDRWVEEDTRVKFAPAMDKPAQRTAVRAELEAGAAAVRGTGFIRLSLNNANLSDYDPTYGEFTVRALAPSSVVNFDALGQKVSLRFGNGKYAQIWRVPAEQAQSIRDRLAMSYGAELEALLVIKSVVPGPGGGTITADVVEYELRENRSGTTLARVQVTGN